MCQKRNSAAIRPRSFRSTPAAVAEWVLVDGAALYGHDLLDFSDIASVDRQSTTNHQEVAGLRGQAEITSHFTVHQYAIDDLSSLCAWLWFQGRAFDTQPFAGNHSDRQTHVVGSLQYPETNGLIGHMSSCRLVGASWFDTA